MILISLLVHENVEVVLDQIANIKKFAPEALIVIHPARQFLESSNIKNSIVGMVGVWLNPKPFYTGFGMVLKCHVSNFLYARKIGIPFTHFCLHSSNDLFVRSGVERYIRSHDFGFFQIELIEGLFDFSYWVQDFQKDKAFKKIMRSIGKNPSNLASQVEGTFYPREAFSQLAACYMRYAWKELPFYSHGKNHALVKLLDKIVATRERRIYFGKYAYPREEFYPANFFSTLCSKPTPPYCLMNWDTELKVAVDDIHCIRKGDVPLKNYKELFSVKRINRDMNDPLRKMIHALETEPTP